MLLVVEDDDTIQMLLRLVLEQAGYQVLLANDGQQGAELFCQHAPAIEAVLLDLTMPRLSGLEVLRIIRERRPELPVLLMSGFSELDLPRECRQQSNTVFVQKPFFPSSLLESVRRLMKPQA